MEMLPISVGLEVFLMEKIDQNLKNKLTINAEKQNQPDVFLFCSQYMEEFGKEPILHGRANHRICEIFSTKSCAQMEKVLRSRPKNGPHMYIF